MGSGAGVRVAAAAAAVLASAATVNVPEKLHLKVTPILFHAVPVSMPLPPLGSSGCSSCGPRFSDSASPPSPSPGSLLPPTYNCSMAQQAAGSPLSVRAVGGHLLPVFLATSVCSPPVHSAAISHSQQSLVRLPTLAPYCFSTAGLYSAPLTEKRCSITTSSSYAHSQVEATASSSTYLESLLSSVLSFQSPLPQSPSKQPSQSLHTWHVPSSGIAKELLSGGGSPGGEKKPVLTVVLLGWLGAQQKHLKKYAEWYNARGIHAVTFVIPMTDLLSLKGNVNAEEHVDSLARHLAEYLSYQSSELEGEKQLIFHTFSNTGWLTYGAILETMQRQGEHFVDRIKGCVVDSAPVPDPDPQVWASGFSAALLKKRSSTTKPAVLKPEVKEGVSMEAASFGSITNLEVGGANGLESAVHSVLEGFFSLFLKLPTINKRLSELVAVLRKKQPSCPQLYIYSTADKVIPVKAVEAFIEEQRKTGRVVRSCNLQTSPHVDHFRSYPQLYSEQLINFLKEVLPSTHHVQTDAPL